MAKYNRTNTNSPHLNQTPPPPLTPKNEGEEGDDEKEEENGDILDDGKEQQAEVNKPKNKKKRGKINTRTTAATKQLKNKLKKVGQKNKKAKKPNPKTLKLIKNGLKESQNIQKRKKKIDETSQSMISLTIPTGGEETKVNKKKKKAVNNRQPTLQQKNKKKGGKMGVTVVQEKVREEMVKEERVQEAMMEDSLEEVMKDLSSLIQIEEKEDSNDDRKKKGKVNVKKKKKIEEIVQNVKAEQGDSDEDKVKVKGEETLEPPVKKLKTENVADEEMRNENIDVVIKQVKNEQDGGKAKLRNDTDKHKRKTFTATLKMNKLNDSPNISENFSKLVAILDLEVRRSIIQQTVMSITTRRHSSDHNIDPMFKISDPNLKFGISNAKDEDPNLRFEKEKGGQNQQNDVTAKSSKAATKPQKLRRSFRSVQSDRILRNGKQRKFQIFDSLETETARLKRRTKKAMVSQFPSEKSSDNESESSSVFGSEEIKVEDSGFKTVDSDFKVFDPKVKTLESNLVTLDPDCKPMAAKSENTQVLDSNSNTNLKMEAEAEEPEDEHNLKTLPQKQELLDIMKKAFNNSELNLKNLEPDSKTENDLVTLPGPSKIDSDDVPQADPDAKIVTEINVVMELADPKLNFEAPSLQLNEEKEETEDNLPPILEKNEEGAVNELKAENGNEEPPKLFFYKGEEVGKGEEGEEENNNEEKSEEKENILQALGLQRLKSVKEKSAKSDIMTSSPSGTLKTVIKLHSKERKKKRRLKIASKGKDGAEGQNGGETSDGAHYHHHHHHRTNRFNQFDPASTDEPTDSDDQNGTQFRNGTISDKSQNGTQVGRYSLKGQDNAKYNLKSHQTQDSARYNLKSQDSASVKEGARTSDSAPLAKDGAIKALVIPEKASSFSIHPGRLCKDECSYCFGKFGLFDTPCHVAQMKSVERQDRILAAEKHLTRDSCLCDACYRHVDRKSSTILTSLTSISTDQGAPAPMTSSTANIMTTCAMCKRRLAKDHSAQVLDDAEEVGKALEAEGMPLLNKEMDSEKASVCKLCRCFASIALKPREERGENSAFFDEYKKRLLHFNNIIRLDSTAAERPIILPTKENHQKNHQNLQKVYHGLRKKTSKKSPKSSSEYSENEEESQKKIAKPSDGNEDGKFLNRTQENEAEEEEVEHVVDYKTLIPDINMNCEEEEDDDDDEDDEEEDGEGDSVSEGSGDIFNDNSKTKKKKKKRKRKKKRMLIDGADKVSLTEDILAVKKLIKVNPSISVRQLFPGEEDLPLNVNINFDDIRDRTPEGWEKYVSIVQYDVETKKLWHHLQKPYGNQSSFLRHLILLEKYFRNGDLMLSPNADHRSINYCESVHNRLRAYDNIPTNPKGELITTKCDDKPVWTNRKEDIAASNEKEARNAIWSDRNQSELNLTKLLPTTSVTITTTKPEQTSRTAPPDNPTRTSAGGIPALISLNVTKGVTRNIAQHTTTQKIKFPITKNWRPNLIPIDATQRQERRAGLVQVISGGKPYHITLEDYKKMCAIKRSFEQRQRQQSKPGQPDHQLLTQPKPEKVASQVGKPSSLPQPGRSYLITHNANLKKGLIIQKKPGKPVQSGEKDPGGSGDRQPDDPEVETILEKLDKQVEKLEAKLKQKFQVKLPKIPKSLTVIPQTVTRPQALRPASPQIEITKKNTKADKK